jgi:hypothetical protein
MGAALSFSLSSSGTVVVTQRTITPRGVRGKDGSKTAVVLKDVQGNVIKVSVRLWTRIIWSWLMCLTEDSQQPDVML